MEENRSRYKVIGVMCILILIILIPFIIIFSGKEEHTSVDTGKITLISSVYCSASVINEPFFVSYDANKTLHELKILFSNGSIDKINYTFTREYNSNEQANEAIATSHADYNIYMSKTNIDQEALQPTFSNIGNNAIINLSLDDKTLTSATAKIISLNDEQYAKIGNYSVEEIACIYKNKGFHCEIQK